MWMTRTEAANYLRVSLRQFTNLRLPRTMLGDRTPRYSKAVLDSHLEQRSITPEDTKGHKKGGSWPPFRVSRLDTSVSTEEQIRRQAERLQRRLRSR